MPHSPNSQVPVFINKVLLEFIDKEKKELVGFFSN